MHDALEDGVGGGEIHVRPTDWNRPQVMFPSPKTRHISPSPWTKTIMAFRCWGYALLGQRKKYNLPSLISLPLLCWCGFSSVSIRMIPTNRCAPASYIMQFVSEQISHSLLESSLRCANMKNITTPISFHFFEMQRGIHDTCANKKSHIFRFKGSASYS